MKKEDIKQIYVVVSPGGKVWGETARLTENECRDSFIKEWISPIKEHIDSHTCWQLWSCFQRAKYKIESIETPQEIIEQLKK